MRQSFIYITALCLVIWEAPATAANRCVSAAGKVSYQDLPCSKDEKASSVEKSNSVKPRSAIDRTLNPPMSEESLKISVLSSLKDPNSADFKDIRHVGDGRALCGQVNSKNSYGGYSGFKSFVADAEGVYWVGDSSTLSDIGKPEARRTYVPRASFWGCLP